MGLFDGLKRNKKAPVTVSGIETVASAQQSDSEVELEDAQLADYEPEELSSEAVLVIAEASLLNLSLT